MDTIRCPGCGEPKPRSDFLFHNGQRTSPCTPCRKLYQKQYRERTREARRQKARAYRDANREAICADLRRRYAEKREIYREKGKVYSANNSAAIVTRVREWRKLNPEKVAAETSRREHRRRARERNAEAETGIDTATVALFYGWNCYICGADCDATLPPRHDRKAEIEHVIPLAKGGTHTFDNVRIACHRCNQLKGANRTPEQVRELLNVAA